MKKKSSIIFLLLISFFGGMIVFKYNLFPRPQLTQVKKYFFPIAVAKTPPPKACIDKIITPYTNGIRLFINRPYFDTIGDSRLEKTFVVQIPRHITTPIELMLNNEVKIYRVLTPSNNNEAFKDWKKTDIPIGIRGASCTHSTIVSKVFPPGKIILESGGPVASSPILIENITNIETNLPITILNQNSNTSCGF